MTENNESNKREIVLKKFTDETGKEFGLKTARNILKDGFARIFCIARCEEEEIETPIIRRFLSLTTFETRDGAIYEIIDTENEPIRCDVVRFVNSETEQETYHDSIAQKWLQEKNHVTAVIVTGNGDSYRTSCIVRVSWRDNLFLTSSARRYLFSA